MTSITYDYQIRDDSGWRTVAVDLTTEDTDAIRGRQSNSWYEPVEGVDYRFVPSKAINVDNREAEFADYQREQEERRGQEEAMER